MVVFVPRCFLETQFVSIQHVHLVRHDIKQARWRIWLFATEIMVNYYITLATSYVVSPETETQLKNAQTNNYPTLELALPLARSLLQNALKRSPKKLEGQTVALDSRQSVDKVSLSRLKLNSDIKHTDGPPSKTLTPTLHY